ncbi:Hint domain-containing protein [Roseicyclus persicicus]|uniref:Hint domain-containing protein n=1 Tax=Roseicyclus persicicus TaxID=2650661 RepID=A0A7X6GZE5_9RHOB|nr:Hint domain-containing protein [Roseibacterium persicicum]NKX44051.1 Hint domain-containing protein [Roseibacterium persicicum]
MEIANTGTVFDLAGTGAGLLSDNDTFTGSTFLTGGTFTGHYVRIVHEGTPYNLGIFTTNNSTWDYCIPFNPALLPFTLVNQIPATSNGSFALYSSGPITAANCFLTGTRIATPQGERPIETLAEGDLVLTADGRTTPVLWVWRQEITNIFGLGEMRTPVRVAAHALGPGCPARDLIVTADHALLVDGFLINAGALVNGTTIHPVPLAKMPATFTYWHVETEAHEAVLAENCPAETFIDYAPRDGFDNYDAYLARYGEERIITEMDVPRISTQRLLLPSLRQRLGIGRAA